MIVCANYRLQIKGPSWILPNGAVLTEERPKWTEIQQIIVITVSEELKIGDIVDRPRMIYFNVLYDRRLAGCRVLARGNSGCYAILRRNQYPVISVPERFENNMDFPKSVVDNLATRPPWHDECRLICSEGHPVRLGATRVVVASRPGRVARRHT